MIEIKNTGKKLVHIGKKPLMPGESVKVSDKVAVTPAIKVFAKRGILSLTEAEEEAADTTKTEETAKTEDNAKTEGDATPAAKAEEPAAATTEKAATAKKTTSTTTKTAK